LSDATPARGGTARWKLPASFAVGALLNLAFAPFGLWPLAIACPALLFALIRGAPAKRAAWTGAAFAAGLFSFGTYWLYTSIHHFGQAPIWLTLILQAALVAIMALYSAALCGLANRFWPRPGVARQWLVLPALWMLLEWLRGWVLSGFPWLALGYAFTDSPLAGWAPFLGVYGLSLIAVLLAAMLEGVWRGEFAPRTRAIAAAAALPKSSGTPSAMPAVMPLSRRLRHAWRRSSSMPAIHTKIITAHHAMPFSAPITCGLNTKL